jgi:hypothetical protein
LNISGITTWQSGGNLQELSSSNFNLSFNNNNIVNMTNDGPLSTCKPIPPSTTKVNCYGVSNNTWIGTTSVQLQPTVTCNPTAGLKAHQYVNMNCFGMPAQGTNGWYQFPYIHGPAYFNSDLAVFKTFKMTERQSLEFRASAFNFLNHPLDSFQNNGDLKMFFNVAQANEAVAAYTFTPANATPPAGVSPLGNSGSFPGYASTRYGRRVMEFSLKYSF